MGMRSVRELTDEEILDIRVRYWDGNEPLRVIGEDYGLHKAQVFALSQGDSRRDAPFPECANPGDPRPNVARETNPDRGTRKLNARIVRELREDFAEGYEWGDITRVAEELDLSVQHVHDILRGNAWKGAGGPIMEGDLRLQAETPERGKGGLFLAKGK